MQIGYNYNNGGGFYLCDWCIRKMSLLLCFVFGPLYIFSLTGDCPQLCALELVRDYIRVSSISEAFSAVLSCN